MVKKKPTKRPKIRSFRLGEGMPDIHGLRQELEDMREVVEGRVYPPINRGVMTMMEVAEAYFSRACEIEQLILEAEQDGRVAKGDHYYTFRTQMLRSFKDQMKSAAELGSRRVTYEQMLWDQEMKGRETA